jgi:hypothetical protein
MQADIKVSFMGPQDIYESQATYAFCSNLYPSGRDTDATHPWLAPPKTLFRLWRLGLQFGDGAGVRLNEGGQSAAGAAIGHLNRLNDDLDRAG